MNNKPVRLLAHCSLFCSFLLIIFCSSYSIASADTIFTNVYSLSQAITNSGNYNNYHLTKAGSPYVFKDGIVLESNYTVNVDAGVEIDIESGKIFRLSNGTFNFNGTADEPITLKTINLNATNFLSNFELFKDARIVSNNPELNLKHVNISGFNDCLRMSTGTANFSYVNIGHCDNFPVAIYGGTFNGDHISVDQGAIQVSNPVARNLAFYFDLVKESLDATPINFTLKDSVIPLDGKHMLHFFDHSIGTFNPDTVHIKINNNSFRPVDGIVAGNTGLFVLSNSLVGGYLPFDIKNNWWGSERGPYIRNVSTDLTLGGRIFGFMNYIPFLTYDPLLENPVKQCCSSVLFLPGIQGSRLYKPRLFSLGGDGYDQLWEPNATSDISYLNMDTSGASANTDIGTLDVVDKINSFGSLGSRDVYGNFLSMLNGMKSDKTIKDVLAFPYDWRVSPQDVVSKDVKYRDGTTKNLVASIIELASKSDTRKVTIVAHSNGGLVAKALVKELEAQGKAGLVDKVVLIAVPQTGTAEGLYAGLHGEKFEGPSRFLLKQNLLRSLGYYMPDIYALMPSKSYFANSEKSVLEFDDSLSSLRGYWASLSGQVINSYAGMTAFASDTLRSRPAYSDVISPEVLPAGFISSADSLHSSIDNYIFPSNIKVTQIVGDDYNTMYGIKYFADGGIQKTKMQSSNIGDGTVVRSSAGNTLGVPSYFVDLGAMNNANGTNLAHADITGTDPVKTLVADVVKDTVINPSVIPYVATTGVDAIGSKRLAIAMHSPANILVTDSTGRRTGRIDMLVDGAVVPVSLAEIPNSSYNEIGEEKYVSVPADGTNQILRTDIDGTGKGKFTLSLEYYTDDVVTRNISYNDIAVTESLLGQVRVNTSSVEAPLDMQIDANGDGSYEKTQKATINKKLIKEAIKDAKKLIKEIKKEDTKDNISADDAIKLLQKLSNEISTNSGIWSGVDQKKKDGLLNKIADVISMLNDK